jgi:hypothetical protein
LGPRLERMLPFAVVGPALSRGGAPKCVARVSIKIRCLGRRDGDAQQSARLKDLEHR